MYTEDKAYRIVMKGISKRFGVVPVLHDVHLRIKPGEIHALIGENGAGKSTLIKILSGVHQKDSGEVYLDGQKINPRNTHEGQLLGINVVFQELSLVNDLSVAENIYLHKLGTHTFWMNWKQINRDAESLIRSLGFDINPAALVRDLSIMQKQVVEIAKALSEDAKVLVLDEPTTVFDPQDIKKLFKTLLKLKEDGISIIYISHHLDEIFQIADTVTVLKDGENAGSHTIDDIDVNGVIKLMIGRELKDLYPVRHAQISEAALLDVTDLTAKDTVVHDVSFSLRSGEVLGIAGLGGSGRTETAKLLFGVDQKTSGTIKLQGKNINTRSPVEAIKHAIGFVPEDRKEEGVFLSLSVKHNISMTNLKPITNSLGMINDGQEDEEVSSLIETLNIKTSSPEMSVKNLSGGNQQKVVLAKWLSVDSQVMIIDEPTRGVDVGAKIEIYKLINDVAEKGAGVIVISSDMGELMGMSDRIIVMHEGTVCGELTKEQFSEENILRYAIGEQLQ